MGNGVVLMRLKRIKLGSTRTIKLFAIIPIKTDEYVIFFEWYLAHQEYREFSISKDWGDQKFREWITVGYEVIN